MLYNLLTKKKDDLLLYEEGVLNDNGRLSEEGRRLVIDLLFQGKEINQIREDFIKAIKAKREEK